MTGLTAQPAQRPISGNQGRLNPPLCLRPDD